MPVVLDSATMKASSRPATCATLRPPRRRGAEAPGENRRLAPGRKGLTIGRRWGRMRISMDRAEGNGDTRVKSGLVTAALVVALVVLGFVVPLVAARHYGAFGIPRGDDWSYLQTLFRFADHGRFDGNNWVSMTLVGQVVVAAPVVAIFGRDIGPVQTTAALMGLVGLVSTYWLARQIVGRGAGAFIALTIAIGPLWGVLVISFMTDVPMFAASMLALALAVAAIRRAPLSMGLFAASVFVGVFAFSIRQYAIVPVIAIVVTAVIAARGDQARRRVAVGIGAAALVVCVVMYGLWTQIPNLKTYVPTIPDGHSISVTIIKSAGFFRLGGLLLAPVVVLANPIRVVRRAWAASRLGTVVLGVGATLALVALSIRVPGQQFVGNYIDANGALSTDVLLGRRPDLFPSGVYAVLVGIATLSAVVLVLATVGPLTTLVARVRARDFTIIDPARFLVALSIVGYAAAYEFAMVTGVSVYDRYALPMVPLVAIAFLASARAPDERSYVESAESADGPGVRWAAAGALVGLAAVGLAFTVDSAAFDGTRWNVAVAATRKGFTRHEINGGFEWVNFYRGSHAPRIVVGVKDGPRRAPTTRPSEFCVTVAVNPLPDGRTILATRRYAVFTRPDALIVALRNHRCRRR